MFLGIEIGGTKLQLGIGPGDGTLPHYWRGPVNPIAGGKGIRKQIVAAIPKLLRQAKMKPKDIRGIGVGFGGPVDDKTQRILKSHQVEGWANFPLSKWLTGEFDLPVALGNDADVAGLAEALFGAGKGLSPIFYITVGSGIGGGLIIDQKIYRGCGRGAAEIGHLPINAEDWTNGLLYKSIVEKEASGWAIAERAGIIVKRDSDLWKLCGSKPEKISTEMVAEAATVGDTAARAAFRHAIWHLGFAICHVIALLCPRRIVIGGGVSLIGEKLFFAPLRKRVAENVFKPFAGLTDIVPAKLGEEVVVHGALALARQRFGEEELAAKGAQCAKKEND
ncbi:MAG TPA: ROK family protein [Gemmataceae bacterium]|jgi:glucokinase|nr:ROK family protein [Gemmataceae bacterium]